MRDSAADLIRVIKAFAAQQQNPGTVYALAQIPEPAAPTPAPPPGRAKDFQVQLNPDGSVTLSWFAENAAISSGAYFVVSRKLPTQAMFTNLGVAPGTSSESRRITFTDATIPASAASAGAQYIVQGFRGTRPGEAGEAITVQFGIDGGGGITSASIKMAA